MPEILRDMMKPVLSLKHLSCQAIAIRYWCNPLFVNFLLVNDINHNQEPQNVELKHWISELGLPKTLETDLCKIGVFLIAEHSDIIRTIGLFDEFHQLDSSLVSLNPTGGIKHEETIVNILQQPQLDNSSKFSLANHFRVFDPSVSDNFEGYIDKLKDIVGLKSLGRHSHLKPTAHEFLSNIPKLRIWEMKRVWKNLSQVDKEQLSGNLGQIVISVKFVHNPHIRDFLLDNLFKEKIHNFWKLHGSEDPVDKFCFDNQYCRFMDNLASPFFYLEQHSTNVVNELLALPDATLSYVLCDMIERIVIKYDNVLYQYVAEIWHLCSDIFKKDFCDVHGETLEDVLHYLGYHNLNYAGRIVLLLQPFDPNLKANTSRTFIGDYLMECLKTNGPFRPPDNYLKKFVGSEDKIAILKQHTIWMARVRITIFANMQSAGNSAIARDIVRWALVKTEECNEYINFISMEVKFDYRNRFGYFVNH